MAENTQGEIESDKEALKTGYDLPGLWLKKIERAKTDERDWHKDAKSAVAIYEVREDSDVGIPAFNILHSNIEITVPSLYNSTPIPDVRRRFGDTDEIAKVAVDIVERALAYSLDVYDFDGTIVEATRDAELCGRGIPRVRYSPRLEQVTPEGGEPYEQVTYQEVTCEHVVWDKWGHGPARHWAEVPWVYFEHELTQDDLEKLNISPERIKSLTFNDADERKDGEGKNREGRETGIMKSVKAYEIWDKASRKVYFVAEQDKKQFLSVQDDPLKLEQFFPIPKAMQPLRRRNSLTPLVPYKVYETQVAELDKVTKRINGLIGQLKVRGLYDKRLGADLERLKYCEDGQYEPADDATVFAQGGGGLEKAIAHWPLAEIVAALQQLYVQRDQIKQTIYEITGLSDVLRGATDPNETLGAQQLKAQQGTTRLSQRQRMVSDCCRHLLRMKAEIICNHFTPENLSAMTGIKVTPEVMQVLQNDVLRSYRIDIETDSTVRADLARTQEQMSLFLQGTAQYASAMAPIIQLQPNAKGGILEIYAAFARQYKLGKSAEDALDQMIEAARQPEAPKPSPEEQKMQLEQQKAEMQAQMDREKGQREMEKMQAELQIKRELAEIDKQMKLLDLEVARAKAEIDMQKAQIDFGLKQDAAALDREAKVYDLTTKREISETDLAAKKEMATIDMHKARASARLDPDSGEDPVQSGMQSVGKGFEQLIGTLAETNERLLESQERLIAAFTAPRSIMVQRGADGRVAGAMSAVNKGGV